MIVDFDWSENRYLTFSCLQVKRKFFMLSKKAIWSIVTWTIVISLIYPLLLGHFSNYILASHFPGIFSQYKWFQHLIWKLQAFTLKKMMFIPFESIFQVLLTFTLVCKKGCCLLQQPWRKLATEARHTNKTHVMNQKVPLLLPPIHLGPGVVLLCILSVSKQAVGL